MMLTGGATYAHTQINRFNLSRAGYAARPPIKTGAPAAPESLSLVHDNSIIKITLKIYRFRSTPASLHALQAQRSLSYCMQVFFVADHRYC